MSRHRRRRRARPTDDDPTPEYPAALIADLESIDRRYPNPAIPALVALFKAGAVHRHLHADAPEDDCHVCQRDARLAALSSGGATIHHSVDDDDDV
jgi:hypothetical protein